MVTTFAFSILLQAPFVHRIHLAETNENFTMAVVFAAAWARFSNDFSAEIGSDEKFVLIRKLETNFLYLPYFEYLAFEIQIRNFYRF